MTAPRSGSKRAAPAAVYALAAVAMSCSCDRDEIAPGTGTPLSSAVVAPSSSSSAKPAPLVAPTTQALGVVAHTCRALAVRGKVTRPEGGTLRTGDTLDDAPWLELDEKSTLVVKHAETGRELTFAGPGAVRPCYQDGEHFLIQRGTVTTAAGMGARPGAEVLLSTPLAALRYGDARLEAQVEKDRVSVVVKQGTAWIEGDEPEPAPEEVAEGGTATRQGKPPDVKALVVRCERSAAAAEERGLAVLDSRAERRTLGVRAAEHLRARQAARKACGIAAAAIGGPEQGHSRAELARRLEAADDQWRRVPRPAKAR
jgi:hypothetical protein